MKRQEEIHISKEELEWWIERRDIYKALLAGLPEFLSQLSNAKEQKIDNDFLEVLNAKLQN